jgi:hypothetical protein
MKHSVINKKLWSCMYFFRSLTSSIGFRLYKNIQMFLKKESHDIGIMGGANYVELTGNDAFLS